jgi:hypothetical protein
MRNLVIERITEYLRLYTDLMYELDIAPDELEGLSNVELLDLLIEIAVILAEDTGEEF